MHEKNASKWSQAVKSLPDRVMGFAMNASLDTLPTNANLCNWKKILNSCSLPEDRSDTDACFEQLLGCSQPPSLQCQA